MKTAKKELKEIIKSVKFYMQAQKLAGIDEFYLDAPSSSKTLEDLRKQVVNCRQCALYKSRTNPVFGAGNPKAKLVFVGEAPGKEEDLKGLPFVGEAGQLLERIIEAMKLRRQDVYICNVLKCRPPENRSPLPAEIISCQDYLRQQLELIRPKVICCLGKFAAQTLLNEQAITKIRGTFHEYLGIKVMPTFHPAYLLRNPEAKALVWQDMQEIMAELKRT